MKRAATLMIQGTASSVGKSLLVAAFCRIYARRGLRVAPFKAQNMALNAHVTPDGFEIGRAQALQARACGLAPEVRMNPILLKPEADSRAQIVLLGKSVGSADAWRYYEDRDSLRKVVTDSLEDLRSQYDLVVIEGAGSPAEINLRERDLVNMFVAHEADAPVLLVGDIDRGGVFAHLFGTLGLLDEADRARIKGFLINKFRGDLRLLEPGLRQIEGHCARPVLGVVPHLPALRLGDEDSLSLDERGPGKRAGGERAGDRGHPLAADRQQRRLRCARLGDWGRPAFRSTSTGPEHRRSGDPAGYQEHARRPRLAAGRRLRGSTTEAGSRWGSDLGDLWWLSDVGKADRRSRWSRGRSGERSLWPRAAAAGDGVRF